MLADLLGWYYAVGECRMISLPFESNNMELIMLSSMHHGCINAASMFFFLGFGIFLL